MLLWCLLRVRFQMRVSIRYECVFTSWFSYAMRLYSYILPLYLVTVFVKFGHLVKSKVKNLWVNWSTVFVLGRKQIRKCVPAVKVPTTFQTILNTTQGNKLKIKDGLNRSCVSRFDRERAGDVLKEEYLKKTSGFNPY